MEKLKLIYQVPAALTLTIISGTTGYFAAHDFLNPDIPNFAMPAPIAAAISAATGIGAASLWKQIRDNTMGKNNKNDKT